MEQIRNTVLILFYIILIALGLKTCNDKQDLKNYQIQLNNLENVKDSLIYTINSLKSVKQKKEIVYIKGKIIKDTLLVEYYNRPIKDTFCDSVVKVLNNNLKDCDSLRIFNNHIINNYTKLDTIYQTREVIYEKIIKSNNRFSLVVGPGLQATPVGIQPGLGVTFGFRIK